MMRLVPLNKYIPIALISSYRSYLPNLFHFHSSAKLFLVLALVSKYPYFFESDSYFLHSENAHLNFFIPNLDPFGKIILNRLHVKNTFLLGTLCNNA